MAVLLTAVACGPPTEPAAVAAPDVARMPGCGQGGYLQARIYGAITASMDWASGDMHCEGMPRPEGEGARLRFAGSAGEHEIAIIIAMPELTRDSTGKELASNVTLIEEGGGRFYSTADLDVCLAEIASIDALDDDGIRYAVSGSVYCVSPLAEVNGESSISIAEMTFSGLLDWSAS